LLVDYFISRTAREYGRQFFFSPECMEILAAYNWPGNVRELENLIERVAIMAEADQIEAKSLPAYLFTRKAATPCKIPLEPAGSRLEMMERETLLESLSRNEWVQKKAAREIGLTLRQMGYRVKKYNLDTIIRENKHRNLQFKKLAN
jgi:Nif-specific regulatory protein